MIDLPQATVDLATPRLRDGYEYWNARRGPRPMPGRADLDPAEIKPLLPHVVLMDVVRNSAALTIDFRYRLIGTLVDDHSSGRFTGRLMSDIAHQRSPSRLWSNFEWVVAERQPKISRVPYAGPHNDFLSVVDIVMPLSQDGETVDMLFCVVDYLARQLR